MERYHTDRRRLVLLAWVCLFFAGLAGPLFAQDNEASALFWSVTRDGEQAGYLLGTIHSEDPRVLDFTESFLSQLGSNDYFAMEIVPDLPTLNRLTQYMQYPDWRTLENQAGQTRYAKLKPLLARYRVPAEWVPKMKVWAVVMTLSVPPPKTGLFMDFSLSLRAAGAGLKVVGLETLEEQLSFLEVMPLEQQLALLDLAMQDPEQSAEIHSQMVDSYLEQDLQALLATADEQLDLLDEATRRMFVERGIEQRNRRMLESLLPLLEQGRVVTAVGALHLPGETGLVQGLKNHGFELAPLPLPLNDAAQESGREPLR